MQRILLIMAVLVLAIAACVPAGRDAGNLEITDVWGRSSPAVAANGAFYMNITNSTNVDDRLLAAASDACGATELHEMYMQEGDVMGMRPVPDGYVTIPAGETVALKVGGLHVMCLDKKSAFEVGDQIPLTLEFANAGSRTVSAEIRDSEMGEMGTE